MLPPLAGGTVRPGMDPPGRGPSRPPRPACPPPKLRANREIPARTQEDGKARLGLSTEPAKAFAPTAGGRQARPKTSPACGLAPRLAVASSLRWVPAGSQPALASLLCTPDCTCFPHSTFGEATSDCGQPRKPLTAHAAAG
nr:dexamethasone-induced protein isoform X1 [Dasypus novemcinctus]